MLTGLTKRFSGACNPICVVSAAILGVGYIPDIAAAEQIHPLSSPMVYAKSLKYWGKELKKYTWLAAAAPLAVRKGIRPWPAGQMDRFTFDSTRTPPADSLPGGWIVQRASAHETRLLTGGYLEFTLVQPATGKSATWMLPEPPRLLLLNGRKKAAIIRAALVPDNHVAFIVSDGSIVLFNWQTGIFGPAAVKASNRSVQEACKDESWNFVWICDGDNTSLYRAADGQIVTYSPLTNDYRIVPAP